MARVGVANYAHSTDNPVKQDLYWREGLERGQRDHAFSVFNEPFPKASYAYVNTTSNDFLSRTWQVLGHTKSVAAGKCSFHHNIVKPNGAVKQNTASASFERVMPPPPRSSSGRAAASGVLSGSASLPHFRGAGMDDDMRSVRSYASSTRRSQRSYRSQSNAYAGMAG
eukprot:TRINITY_DN4151_c0_g5_i1.p1 TRINITY_DN4151_c0_g5~~TRINITY_DN4151_c0_g5_i1.p1  ORF type:complete len:168 (-),score=22.46 TRINITY_DN4151_c0_g5_i1:152-655(-)